MNKSKKIISILAAATLACSTLALSACGKEDYKGDTITYTSPTEKASSNGGFVVEHGEYVYFINGVAQNTDENVYGEVVKGSLMRITKTDLAAGKYDNAKTVVPSLFVAGDYTSGVYIYGDYVYYATPTTDKDKDGQVANTSLDFKRAKLDGTEAPMGSKNDYFFRLTTNTAKYRYVEVGNTVYCLYEEDSKLKSYNTKTETTTVLVSGASAFYYDTNDLTNPNVYYTMGVTYDVDKATSTSAQYNQIYCVNAANTATVDASTAKYTVKNGEGKEIASYDFDEAYLNKKNEEAKEDKKDLPYDLKDYATYPYVNLGQLVLDGVGRDSYVEDTRFNKDSFKTDAATLSGYTYTIQQQTNGGVYFTRTEIASTGNDPGYLYYLSNEATSKAAWNTVTGNKEIEIVSKDTTTASASALYDVVEGKHSYIYVDGTTIKKATETETITIAYNVASGSTLWQTKGDYLYYYGSGTNGNNVTRLNYKGSQADYDFLGDESVYAPVTADFIDWSDSWYKPELVEAGGKTFLLYPNAQSYGAGSTAYNYVYAAALGDIKASNEEYAKVKDYIDEYSDNSALQDVMTYYFRTGKTTAFDAVKSAELGLYNDYQRKEFDAFKKKFTDNEFKLESAFVAHVGKMTETDVEAIDEAWANSLLQKEETEEESGLPTWAIVLIIVGGVLILATAITLPTVYMVKKDKEEKAKREAIVNAFEKNHKKIDTTDDKSIDVYAMDEPEETAAPVEESAPVEETAAPVEESAPVEETAVPVEESAPVEETVAPVEESAPVEETAAPAEESAPVEETAAPVEESAPVEETAAPVEESAPVEETVAPVEESAPVEEMATPEETKEKNAPEKDVDKE